MGPKAKGSRCNQFGYLEIWSEVNPQTVVTSIALKNLQDIPYVGFQTHHTWPKGHGK